VEVPVKAHLTTSTDPLNFALRPPEMTAMCGARVVNAEPVMMQELVMLGLPELSSLYYCSKCVAAVNHAARPEVGKQYLYAITPEREATDHQHSGDTILECEQAVERVTAK
jgi:hypothetical protein